MENQRSWRTYSGPVDEQELSEALVNGSIIAIDLSCHPSLPESTRRIEALLLAKRYTVVKTVLGNNLVIGLVAGKEYTDWWLPSLQRFSFPKLS